MNHGRDPVRRERGQREHGAGQQTQPPQLRPPQPPWQTRHRQRGAACIPMSLCQIDIPLQCPASAGATCYR